MKYDLYEVIQKAADQVLKLGEETCINIFSDNISYAVRIINPENEEVLNYKQKLLFVRKQSLLSKNEVVPKIISMLGVISWMDFELFSTDKDKTIILLNLIKSDQPVEFPDIHICIENPPFINIGSKEKFDINWRNSGLLKKKK